MADKFEALIKKVYQGWKKGLEVTDNHPDEEAMACFIDGRLTHEENEQIQAHLVTCDNCAQILSLSLSAERFEGLKEAPKELLEKAQDILKLKDRLPVFEVILRLKENMLEIIKANGDILLGQELIPAPVLRSRKIKDFKDEVTILKDFKDIRVEVRVDNKDGKYFNVMIKAKHRYGEHLLKDLRVTLIKEGVELESYLSDTGSVSFEHVLLGKYHLELTSVSDKLASVVLDVKF